MDFGVVGLDYLVGTEALHPSMVSDSGTNQNDHGSGFLKQLRSGFVEDDWRSLKMGKNLDFLESKSMFQQQEQLISFSSAKSEALLHTVDGLVNPTFPYYHHYKCSSPCVKNTSLNVEMHGARGPFTPSQWMELEHQALIYKYINSNVLVPSNLLIPITKALNPSQFSGSLRPNSLQWGSFHLSFSRNMDPEPGRCRRTDGKKWRCSRDAVVDQKYCERHINRGRHRSRKPVEGHSGHSASGKRTINNLTISQQPIKTDVDRIFVNKDDMVDRTQKSRNFPMLSSSLHLKPEGAPLFSTSKEHIPFEETSQTEYGLITSRNLNHFIDSWPKDQSNSMPSSWTDIEETLSDRTQLSISIPVTSSDFSSSSSLTNENFETSPLKLSDEFDPMQMDLGVSNVLNKGTQRQANRVPILWETSMGGPLGEALSKINNTLFDFKDSSSIERPTFWGSSPTGVLQRASFGSLSNSSTGSSPRTENNRTNELRSAVANSASSIASL